MNKDLLKTAGLPKASFSTWRGPKRVSEKAEKWLAKTHQDILQRRSGYHLLLLGPSISGKTFLCSAMLNCLRKKGHSFRYHRIPLYLESIFTHYREGSKLVEEGLRPHILVLEDLGREATSGYPHTRKYISLMLTERKCGMVLTSRKDLNSLSDIYGPSLMTDIKNRCIIIRCPMIPALREAREENKTKWLESES